MLAGSLRRLAVRSGRPCARRLSTVGITVRLPEDAVMETRAAVGMTLLEALEAADLNDIWEGGACGGACNCSTCRVVVHAAPAPLAAREEDELDMLDSAALQADSLAAAETYLSDGSRLACQLTLRAEDDGIVVELPGDVVNMLEVPLWMRNR